MPDNYCALLFPPTPIPTSTPTPTSVASTATPSPTATPTPTATNTPTPSPTPTPTPTPTCSVMSLGTLSGSITRTGSWSYSCNSTHRSGSYARFYSFTVSPSTQVTIDLTSSVDTYLYLLQGSGTSGSVIESDDDDGGGTNSRIVRTLSSGTYTVEATTYYSAQTGSFTLIITPVCSVTSLGTLSGSITRTGSWSNSCNSTHRSGSYARFYSFTVSQSSQVTIDLTSSEDSYLYLLQGSGTSGSVIESDDDDGVGTNSRIVRTLSSGTYTVEATTYYSAQTGSFTLTITGPAPPTPTPTPTATPTPTPTATATPTPTATATNAECPIDEGVQDYQWSGFSNASSSYTLGTRAIRADLWNYNPAPVYGDVSFWVMLADSTGENYAQVGWGKTEDDSVEYVFGEFTGENGFERWFYDAEDDEWVGTESTQPPSSKSYKVTWVEGTSGDHQIQIVYDGSTSQDVTVSWTAVGYHVTGEVHDYQSVVGTDKGDHSPGHGGVDGVNANRIHAENIQAVRGKRRWLGRHFWIHDYSGGRSPRGQHVQRYDIGFRSGLSDMG